MTTPPNKIDLHTHTTASDGRLTPDELLRLAVEKGVSTLAITDHDSVAAYDRISSVPNTLTLVTGCEFSTRLGKQEIHLVGLHFDRQHTDIQCLIAQQAQARLRRAEQICRKLQKLGIDIDVSLVREQCKLSETDILTSPHIAKTLLNLGIINQPQQAYKRYLGIGKKAFVRPEWANPENIIASIHRAGGVALLAHPLGYNLTRTKRIELIHQFATLGGDGFEIVSGHQGKNNTAEMITLCQQLGLIASVGSDFHAPYPYRHELGINLTQLEKTHPALLQIKNTWSVLDIK